MLIFWPISSISEGQLFKNSVKQLACVVTGRTIKAAAQVIVQKCGYVKMGSGESSLDPSAILYPEYYSF